MCFIVKHYVFKYASATRDAVSDAVSATNLDIAGHGDVTSLLSWPELSCFLLFNNWITYLDNFWDNIIFLLLLRLLLFWLHILPDLLHLFPGLFFQLPLLAGNSPFPDIVNCLKYFSDKVRCLTCSCFLC